MKIEDSYSERNSVEMNTSRRIYEERVVMPSLTTNCPFLSANLYFFLFYLITLSDNSILFLQNSWLERVVMTERLKMRRMMKM